MSEENWKLLRHNQRHHGKGDISTSNIVNMKKIDDIAKEDIKTRWIDLYLQDGIEDDSNDQLYVPVFTSI